MKFVVNKVHQSSAHYCSAERLHGREICIDDNFGKSSVTEGYCKGSMVYNNIAYSCAFTVAEVPDTEEGYYLL